MPRNLDALEAFGFNPIQTPFTSRFLDPTLTGSLGSNRDGFAFASMANGKEILSLGVGRAAQEFGMIDTWIAPYRDFAGTVVTVANDLSTAVDAFSTGDPNAALRGVWDGLEGLIQVSGVLEEMPIIGWIAAIGQFGWTVGQMIWEEHNPKEGSSLAPAVTYNAPDDQARTAQILDSMAGNDWTPIWLPTNRGPWQIRTQKVQYKSGAKGWATALEHAAPTGGGLGLGCMPGVDTLAQVWQSEKAEKLPKIMGFEQATGKPLGNPNLALPLGLERYRPSMQQASVAMWQHVLRNGPDMFRVNSREIRFWWGDYFLAWRQLGATPGIGEWWESFLFRVLTTATIGAPLTRVQYGPAQGLGPYRTLAVWPRHVYPLLGYPKPGKRDARQPVSVLTAGGYMQYQADQLQSRQLNALNTLTVAYLTGNEPAFRNSRGWVDQDLIDRFELRRAQLLEHPALRLVEMDMVPPGDWKREAQDRLIGGTLSAAMEGPATAQFSVAGELTVGPPLTSGAVQSGLLTSPGAALAVLAGLGLVAAVASQR